MANDLHSYSSLPEPLIEERGLPDNPFPIHRIVVEDTNRHCISPPDLSDVSRTRLSQEYSEITECLSQWHTELARCKTSMDQLMESVPSQAQLTSLWKDQARELTLQKKVQSSKIDPSFETSFPRK